MAPVSSDVDVAALKKKLATLTVINGALRAENDELRAGRGTPSEDEATAAELDECRARLAEADDALAALTRERDDLVAELASTAEGGDAASKALRDKSALASKYKLDLEASARRCGELEGTHRKLTLRVKNLERDLERAANRAKARDESAAEAAEDAADRERAARAETERLRARLAESERDADREAIRLRAQLAEATRAAREAVGKEAQTIVEEAED